MTMPLLLHVHVHQTFFTMLYTSPLKLMPRQVSENVGKDTASRTPRVGCGG